MKVIILNKIHKIAITDANIPTSLNRLNILQFIKLNLVPLKTIREETIDLSELPNSIYLLRLFDNSKNVLGTSKVIKK